MPLYTPSINQTFENLNYYNLTNKTSYENYNNSNPNKRDYHHVPNLSLFIQA